MALENLEKGIMENARKEAERVVAEALKEAKAIENEARKRVNARKRELEEELQRQLENMKRVSETKSRMRAKQALMEEKKRIIDSVYESFRAKLEKNKAGVMESLYRKASEEISPERVYVRPADVKLAREIFSGLKVEEKDMTGGFILESKDREQTIDYSFDTILEIIRLATIRGVSKELEMA